jgi:SAM-dependent methyltransferase
MPADPYADGTAVGYWHLSRPSPELLEALDRGWLRQGMRVLDLGCGLATDIGYLGSLGFSVTGVDASAEAIRQARRRYPGIELVVADVRALPFADRSFDYLLDRGCFHYLAPEDRPRYAAEAWRVLREGGELLLRACLNNQGIRNDITPAAIEATFDGWQIVTLELGRIATDTRELEAVFARLRRAV